ncbi:MAG: hypothetical protein U5K33_01030 [Halofilum sp. (in: g-proteobacteria)]|nr:hypothetical protein [Halofilum sp. (in: g-proteobacteria)]
MKKLQAAVILQPRRVSQGGISEAAINPGSAEVHIRVYSCSFVVRISSEYIHEGPTALL